MVSSAYDTHFRNAHFIQQASRSDHGVHVSSVHVCLCHYAEAVFNAKRNRAERILLGTLAVSQPIVVPETVKGDLDKGIAPDLLHPVEDLLSYVKPVGIQLLNVHTAAVYALKNRQKALVAHRLNIIAPHRVPLPFGSCRLCTDPTAIHLLDNDPIYNGFISILSWNELQMCYKFG